MNLFCLHRRVVVLAFVILAGNSHAQFHLLSRPDPNLPAITSGNGDSALTVMSEDGRYVIFGSMADNLIASNAPGTTSPSGRGTMNVFFRDRAARTTALVSLALDGLSGGNQSSLPLAISTNGRLALFESSASNLWGSDTNDAGDVFVRDTTSNLTTLVSTTIGGFPGNGASYGGTMTPNGRYVVFTSAATNLVTGDTNRLPDVFIRDRQNNTTALISVGARTTNAAFSSFSTAPDITPDGRYVVFYSSATNLVAGNYRGGEIYVRDRQTATTVCASRYARQLFFQYVGNSNAVACNFQISENGRYVSYVAAGINSARGVALRQDLQGGATDLISTNVNVDRDAPFEDQEGLDMTPDGRYITYVGNVGGVSGNITAIYRFDAYTGERTLVSTNRTGGSINSGSSSAPRISADGQRIIFISSLFNLVTNTVPGDGLYLRDLVSGTTRLLTLSPDGRAIGGFVDTFPNFSPDGKWLTFHCSDDGLLTGEQNALLDVFTTDVEQGTNDLISACDPSWSSRSANRGSGWGRYSLSADGSRAAFVSDATDLSPDDTNYVSDIFVRDLGTGSNYSVTRGTNGVAANGISLEPALAGNGRFVVFTSQANNLIAGDTNQVSDIFLRDLQTDALQLISTGQTARVIGNKDSYQPEISADGRRVLFWSKASNVAAGSFGTAIENLFLRDRQTASTLALTTASSGTGVVASAMTPDGRYIAYVGRLGAGNPMLYVWDTAAGQRIYTNTTASLLAVAISPNGQRVAYATASVLSLADVPTRQTWTVGAAQLSLRPGLRFSADGNWLAYATKAPHWAGDTNGTFDVYLHDALQRTNGLISRSFNSDLVADDQSDAPDISADGRFIAYRSEASNLVAGDTNGLPDLFLFDRQTGLTSLLTRSRSHGNSANNRSRTPLFSADGKTFVYHSVASDLIAGDGNAYGDLFAYPFLDVRIGSPFSSEAGPVLSWPAVPGQTYRVQYKTTLEDLAWTDLSGGVQVVGIRAWWTNAPETGLDRRFYRVVAD